MSKNLSKAVRLTAAEMLAQDGVRYRGRKLVIGEEAVDDDQQSGRIAVRQTGGSSSVGRASIHADSDV